MQKNKKQKKQSKVEMQSEWYRRGIKEGRKQIANEIKEILGIPDIIADLEQTEEWL